MRLNPLAFGLACGIMWSVQFVLVTVFNMVFGRAQAWVDVLADLYPGYSATVPGMVAGAALGFVDALVFCAILAWLYNTLIRRCPLCAALSGGDASPTSATASSRGVDQ